MYIWPSNVSMMTIIDDFTKYDMAPQAPHPPQKKKKWAKAEPQGENFCKGSRKSDNKFECQTKWHKQCGQR